MITLDKKWSILPDTYSWELRFTETRVREKVDAKKVKTGEVEDFEFVNSWWYPKISMCLNKFKEESLKTIETVEEILSKLDSIDKKIGEIKNDTFKPC